MSFAYYLASGVLLFSTAIVLVKVKRSFECGKQFDWITSLGFWILDVGHFLLVFYSSWHSFWLLPFNKAIALFSGLVISLIGGIVMLSGMIEFKSIRKLSGLNDTKLITTGIYKYGRNPQYLGWIIILLGISISGRSFFSMAIVLLSFVFFHLYILLLEEPYLIRIFGEEYRKYKSTTPRYFELTTRTRNNYKHILIRVTKIICDRLSVT